MCLNRFDNKNEMTVKLLPALTGVAVKEGDTVHYIYIISFLIINKNINSCVDDGIHLYGFVVVLWCLVLRWVYVCFFLTLFSEKKKSFFKKIICLK